MKWEVTFYDAADEVVTVFLVECAFAHNAAKVALRDMAIDARRKACQAARRIVITELSER